MAYFNAITLEQNAIKREKIERRRGPKPVRTSLLWAQTIWLEANIALSDGRVVFQSDAHTWNFDGALLEKTKRALDKLAFRSLSRGETERLEARRLKLALWSECASLEHIASADLRSRFVLESLLNAPLTISAARELARLPLSRQSSLLRELEGEFSPAQTRNLAHWVARNRNHDFWRRNTDFPVNLACRLGFEGDTMPALFQNVGPLSLDIAAIVSLLEEHTPQRTLEIVHFWSQAHWQWPSTRHLRRYLKPSASADFCGAWRELELKCRANWMELWREMAIENLETATRALQFHELMMDENLVQWQDSIYKSVRRAVLLAWFEARNTRAFELMKTIRNHPDASTLIDLMSELWIEYIEYKDDEAEGFWNNIVIPTIQSAKLAGVQAAQELRAADQLHLVRGFDKKPELFHLALEWVKRGEGYEWAWQLRRLPSDARNAAFLHREAEQFFALYASFPDLDVTIRSEVWDAVLPSDEKRAFDPAYWRFIRVLAPIFIQKMRDWHEDNASNLRDWLVLWAGVACDFSWQEAELFSFCDMILSVTQREFKVCEEAPERLNNIEGPLETFAQLCHHAGESSQKCRERCEVLLNWLCHGKPDRTYHWWDALKVASKLKQRPRLCAALLLVSERSPAVVREVLPQIDSLKRLRLTAEIDAIEQQLALPDGELKELSLRFPTLQASIVTLGEWQARIGNTPYIPSGIREMLSREDKWRHEAEFLRARLAQSPDAHLQIRLANLEQRVEAGANDVEAELATALGTAVELAIAEALRSLVTRALRGRLRFLCGSAVDDLQWNDDWANAILIACEVDSNRKWATKLLRGQSHNSSGWQRHIEANQKWLHDFATQGKNREHFEAPHQAQFGDWELWIERDALQILQMGNRFSTCLSRGGCNSHSTIANALDANKLVVYAKRDGQIQARQLWAVTKEGKLGGFEIYANLSQSAREKSGVSLAFFEFASQFAGACGMELNEDTNTEIPTICGAQWYDDGLISWAELKAGGEKQTPSNSTKSKPSTHSKRRSTTTQRTVEPHRNPKNSLSSS
ncbi:hypothetical protein EON83_23160 [bacterium]|nr:MAG: hypothetical protein EON83_23160 [bacterium]